MWAVEGSRGSEVPHRNQLDESHASVLLVNPGVHNLTEVNLKVLSSLAAIGHTAMIFAQIRTLQSNQLHPIQTKTGKRLVLFN